MACRSSASMLGSRTALRRILTIGLTRCPDRQLAIGAALLLFRSPLCTRRLPWAGADHPDGRAQRRRGHPRRAGPNRHLRLLLQGRAAALSRCPHQRPLDEKATLAELADIAAGHSRIWVVYYGDQQADPTRVIASWLEQKAFKASDRWFGNVRLVLYAMPQASAGGMQPVNVGFGPAIRLMGYRLEAAAATAGDIVPLTLFWQAGSAVSERYVVFAHIIDTHNALWGQRDSEPGGGLQPTTTWRVGETMQDNYGIPILPGTPPGSYQIEIGMYRPDSGQRLQVTDSSGEALGDRVLIGPLVVDAPGHAAHDGCAGHAAHGDVRFRRAAPARLQPGAAGAGPGDDRVWRRRHPAPDALLAGARTAAARPDRRRSRFSTAAARPCARPRAARLMGITRPTHGLRARWCATSIACRWPGWLRGSIASRSRSRIQAGAGWGRRRSGRYA